MIPQIEAAGGGLAFVGKDETGQRMEILEMAGHPWFVGVQFHPEYLSRVLAPSKTYLGFFAAAGKCLNEITRDFCGRKDLSHLEVKPNETGVSSFSSASS